VSVVLTVSALADFDGAPGGSASPTCRTDQDDTLADFSNYGNPVGIIAPSGNTGSDTISIEVQVAADPPSSGTELSATATKVRSRYSVELTWTGASGPVDVFRDLEPIAQDVAGSSYVDSVKPRGESYYLYLVCPAGVGWLDPNVCSNQVVVAF
jgi:hypothetical protein